MVDGVTTMDPGVNRPASRISSEAISEIKVDTFGYQAEYGRAAGLQINAVTKSGTNQFRGSLYDVERHTSLGYANSKTNILNGDPDPLRRRAGPGLVDRRPGRASRAATTSCSSIYNQEFNPRTVGNRVFRYRVPTELERQGDFSKTTDNQGNPFPFIKNPAVSGTCSATSTAACFADGGVRRQDPGLGALPDRHERSQLVAEAEPGPRARAGVQLREHLSEDQAARMAAGPPRSITSRRRTSAGISGSRNTSSRTTRFPAPSPASTTPRRTTTGSTPGRR